MVTLTFIFTFKAKENDTFSYLLEYLTPCHTVQIKIGSELIMKGIVSAL